VQLLLPLQMPLFFHVPFASPAPATHATAEPGDDGGGDDDGQRAAADRGPSAAQGALFGEGDS
jgi:hypothetical protein